MQECREVLSWFGLKLEAFRSSFIYNGRRRKTVYLCLHKFCGLWRSVRSTIRDKRLAWHVSQG